MCGVRRRRDGQVAWRWFLAFLPRWCLLAPSSTTIWTQGVKGVKRLKEVLEERRSLVVRHRRFGLLKRLIDNRSQLSVTNKLSIYITIIIPICTYVIELQGSTKSSNIIIIIKSLNSNSYEQLRLLFTPLIKPSTIPQVASSRYKSFHFAFQLHSYPLVNSLSFSTL